VDKQVMSKTSVFNRSNKNYDYRINGTITNKFWNVKLPFIILQ